MLKKEIYFIMNLFNKMKCNVDVVTIQQLNESHRDKDIRFQHETWCEVKILLI